MQAQAVTTDSARVADPALRPAQAAAYVGLSRTTVWRLRAAGDFPEPFRLSEGSVAWRQSQLDDWLDQRQREVG